MKKRTIYIFFLLLMTSGCEMHDARRPSQPVGSEPDRMLVLSEGLFNMNNSTLALVDIITGQTDYDIFRTVNRRGLGDTANDLKRYGSKLYIAVDISSQIEVLDARTFVSLARIPAMTDEGQARQPRRLEPVGGHVYVSCFDGSVLEIDTTSLAISRITQAGRNPDNLCSARGKLYVSNSGGLDYPFYDATVSVIDIASFRETRRIDVGINPGVIGASARGDVYVISRGDYGENDYRLLKIDSDIDTVVRRFDNLNPLGFCIVENTMYMYNYNYEAGTHWVKCFDCLTDRVTDDAVVDPAVEMTTPYSVMVAPSTGNIYMTEARQFVLFGDVLCFGPDGKLRYRLPEIGLNPNTVLLLDY